MSTTSPGNGLEIPRALARGVPMLKISSKKIKQVIIRIEDSAIHWASRRGTKGKYLLIPLYPLPRLSHITHLRIIILNL
jgi:hypothetical protein